MDDEPSNIRPAQPKSGLETGPLEGAKGGLSTKQRVAEAYEGDLSGANGPEKRFDTLNELIELSIQRAMNKMTFTSPGGVQIFGRGGRFAIVPGDAGAGETRRREVREKSSVGLWDLDVVDAEAGTVKILRPGIVKRTNALDASGVLSIDAIGDTFTAEAGKILVLEVEPNFNITAVMKSAGWDGWPYPYEVEVTSPGGLWKWTKYYYPLWDFRSSESSEPGAIKINDSLWAEKRGFSTHLKLEPYESQSASGPVVATYEMVPAVGARRP